MALSGVNEKIKFVREYLQLTPGEFAGYLDVSEEAVLAVEKPGAEIPVGIMLSLLGKMNVSADWLLTAQGDIFTKPGLLNNPSVAALPQNKIFYLEEAELDRRIQEMEASIKSETHLPLEQIRALFSRLLNLELEEPEENGKNPFPEISLDRLSFFEKAVYYQELQQQFQSARKKFLKHFSKLIQLTRDNPPRH